MLLLASSALVDDSFQKWNFLKIAVLNYFVSTKNTFHLIQIVSLFTFIRTSIIYETVTHVLASLIIMTRAEITYEIWQCSEDYTILSYIAEECARTKLHARWMYVYDRIISGIVFYIIFQRPMKNKNENDLW